MKTLNDITSTEAQARLLAELGYIDRAAAVCPTPGLDCDIDRCPICEKGMCLTHAPSAEVSELLRCYSSYTYRDGYWAHLDCHEQRCIICPDVTQIEEDMAALAAEW